MEYKGIKEMAEDLIKSLLIHQRYFANQGQGR